VNPIEYDRVTIRSDPARDTRVIEWWKKKFLQVRIFNGKIHIKINGLKVFKTMRVDGIELKCGSQVCKDCLLKYGEKIRVRKSLLGQWHYCPLCFEKSI